MKTKKSEIFWTSILALVLLILRYIVGLELFLVIWLGLGSIISIFGLLTGINPKTETIKINLWLIVFPTTWLIVILYNVILACEYFYKKVIKPFNDKLNGENN